jgi:hypothetical protein
MRGFVSRRTAVRVDVNGPHPIFPADSEIMANRRAFHNPRAQHDHADTEHCISALVQPRRRAQGKSEGGMQGGNVCWIHHSR